MQVNKQIRKKRDKFTNTYRRKGCRHTKKYKKNTQMNTVKRNFKALQQNNQKNTVQEQQ